MEKIVMKVKGMVCNGCEARIQNSLMNMDGVLEVVANHTKGNVTIVGDDRLDKSIIFEKIEDLGFEVEVNKE